MFCYAIVSQTGFHFVPPSKTLGEEADTMKLVYVSRRFGK